MARLALTVICQKLDWDQWEVVLDALGKTSGKVWDVCFGFCSVELAQACSYSSANSRSPNLGPAPTHQQSIIGVI